MVIISLSVAHGSCNLVLVILIERSPCIYNLVKKENLHVSYVIFAYVTLVTNCIL
jgi:hypothetical protein